MSEGKGFLAYLLLVAGLFLLRLLFGFVAFPAGVAAALSYLSTVLFIGLPVYALFLAASHRWTAKPGVAVLAVGAAIHVACALVLRFGVPPDGPGEVFFSAVVQASILVWTLGIGVLLSLLVRDQNLMIPIAIFLVGFDMFLVFNPESPTRRLMEGSPGLVQSALASVPAPKVQGQGSVGVSDLAYVGPADLLFTATFFALMFRFGMRARETLLWLVPVLVAYLGTVIFLGDVRLGPLSLAMLPAMVPIGLTVLLVNRRSFKLNGQEAAGVAIVALVAIGLAGFGVYRARQAAGTRPTLPVGPSPTDDDLGPPVLQGSPMQAP